MNLGALLDQFYRDADDRALPHIFAETDVTDWLNEAESEAATRGRLIFDRDSSVCFLGIIAGDVRVDFNECIDEIVYARLLDSAGSYTDLAILDRVELERTYPLWRETTDKPAALAFYDKHLQTNCLPDADYTVEIEVYRRPRAVMSIETDEPEISSRHHARLVDWALHRALEVPDTDMYSPDKSALALARFEQYFGHRPRANSRKEQSSNRPHRVKCHW